jgi:pimeloyl-ACP methyl ester carboxylesterase
MSSLRAPPKQETPSRLVARIVFLLVLATAAGVVIYTSVTNQRVDLTEDVREAGIELDNPSFVDDMRINVVEDPGGEVPVVFLHDVDVTGGIILEPVSTSLGGDYRGVRIDLPGFGYSTRLPFETPQHTAARMAETVSLVFQDRFDSPVVVVGIGFGGEVAADLALSYPGVVRGLVMVDVEFDDPDSTQHFLETLPWIGKAATYTWETGGRFALGEWSPYCDQGGWCPSQEQLGRRAAVITIEGTTESLHWFRRTPEAALAPSNLEDIEVPVAYVWSSGGDIEQGDVESIEDAIPDMTTITSDTFQVHLEDFPAIASAVVAVDSASS